MPIPILPILVIFEEIILFAIILLSTLIFELTCIEPPINKDLLISVEEPILIFPDVKIFPFKLILPFSIWVIELLNNKFDV